MKDEIKKTILSALHRMINILEKDTAQDFEELKKLSDELIEDVALYKDLDVISITVLIYSIYKIVNSLPTEEKGRIVKGLTAARKHLEQQNMGVYNKDVKSLYSLIKGSNSKIKEHLHDVMHAARIKKSAILLGKGLSVGQAAGLMGLSNWDLQEYAGKTNFFEAHQEKYSAIDRLTTAFKVFAIK